MEERTVQCYVLGFGTHTTEPSYPLRFCAFRRLSVTATASGITSTAPLTKLSPTYRATCKYLGNRSVSRIPSLCHGSIPPSPSPYPSSWGMKVQANIADMCSPHEPLSPEELGFYRVSDIACHHSNVSMAHMNTLNGHHQHTPKARLVFPITALSWVCAMPFLSAAHPLLHSPFLCAGLHSPWCYAFVV